MAAKKQTQSIAVQSIAAINKAENILANMAKFNAEFVKAIDNVETLKSDLDLGFKQYEVEMEEKKAKLVSDYEAKSEALGVDFTAKEASFKAQLEAITSSIVVAKADAERKKEELTYELNKHVERENLEAAQSIAWKFDKDVVSADLVDSLREELALAKESVKKAVEEAEDKVNASKHIAISAIERDAKAAKALLEGKLESALERANRAEESVKYLQGRLDLVPQQIADAVKAAKADIAFNNDNSGRK